MLECPAQCSQAVAARRHRDRSTQPFRFRMPHRRRRPRCGDALRAAPARRAWCAAWPHVPGGYCTAPCGADRQSRATARASRPRSSASCACKPCTNDADCRAERGLHVRSAVARVLAAELRRDRAEAMQGHRRARRRVQGRGAHRRRARACTSSSRPRPCCPTAASSRCTSRAAACSRATRSASRRGKTHDQPFKTAKQSHFDPWVARDRSGTVHAVWYGFDGRDQNGEIAHATTKDGVTWTQARRRCTIRPTARTPRASASTSR